MSVIRILLTKSSICNFIKAFFTGLGISWLISEILLTCNPQLKANILYILSFGILLSIICFLFEGLYLKGYLKRFITIAINNANLHICFGDLFKFDGLTVISMNEYFDTEVDDKYVAKRSLHGILITNCFANQKDALYGEIIKDLKNAPCEVVERTSPARNKKFALGTTAYVSNGTSNFLVTALTHTNLSNNKAHININEYQGVISQMLDKAFISCSGRPLNLSLIGDGQASLNISPNILLSLLLVCIFEKSKYIKVAEDIRIVLHPKYIGKINLATVKEIWEN